MASSINASTSGPGGVITTADNSGILNLQSGGTTVATVGPSGLSTPAASTINTANTFGFKNRIINGAMNVQQYGTGSFSNVGSNTYVVDRFYMYGNVSSKFTSQVNAGSVTPPVGFSNYLGFTSSSAYSVASGDIFYAAQKIEAFNVADLGWGTANAKTVTLSFWAYSSLTGTFGGSLLGPSFSYAYPFSYSIPVANTWTQISITIAGPTGGTWNGATNSVGLLVGFGLGVGTSGSGTAGSWQSGSYYSSTGATSLVGTNGATWYVTGVQLELGSQATSFDFRSIGTELGLCQRYAIVYSNALDGNDRWFGYAYTTTSSLNSTQFPVTMRSAPTATISTATTFTLYTQLSAGTISSMNLDTSSTKNANMNTVVSSAIASGQGTILAFNDSGNKITFSAEL